jgi:hypothetical protein
MDFLKQTDFDGILAESVYTALGDDIDTSEELAISELDPLRGKYNIDAELAKSDANRNRTLVRILVHITAYYLYNTVPDDEIPDRIVDNYKKEIATIEKIAAGKLNSTLITNLDDEGNSVTVFRWNSNRERSHSLYPPEKTAKESI